MGIDGAFKARYGQLQHALGAAVSEAVSAGMKVEDHLNDGLQIPSMQSQAVVAEMLGYAQQVSTIMEEVMKLQKVEQTTREALEGTLE